MLKRTRRRKLTVVPDDLDKTFSFLPTSLLTLKQDKKISQANQYDMLTLTNANFNPKLVMSEIYLLIEKINSFTCYLANNRRNIKYDIFRQPLPEGSPPYPPLKMIAHQRSINLIIEKIIAFMIEIGRKCLQGMISFLIKLCRIQRWTTCNRYSINWWYPWPE